MSKFQECLQEAKKAEQLVLNTFQSLTSEYKFIDVSEDSKYYDYGDIKAVDKYGNEIMIEVKDDSRIAETQNLLCEEEVYYKDIDRYVKGNFHSNYQIYCVVSRSEQKIYVLDFSKLKQHYKSGEFKVIPHADQITYCYLLPLGVIRRFSGLIDIVHYGPQVEKNKKIL